LQIGHRNIEIKFEKYLRYKTKPSGKHYFDIKIKSKATAKALSAQSLSQISHIYVHCNIAIKIQICQHFKAKSNIIVIIFHPNQR
jgi:hypothetical protein